MEHQRNQLTPGGWGSRILVLDTRHSFPVSTVSQLLRVSFHKENILYPSELSFTLESFPDPPNPQTEVLRSHAQWVMFVFRMPIAWVKIWDPWKPHTLKLISPFRKPMHHRTSSLAMILSLRLKRVRADSQVSESQNGIVILKISLTDFIDRIHGSLGCSRNWTYDWLLQIFSYLIYGWGKRERG